jgi:hypothetical protein
VQTPFGENVFQIRAHALQYALIVGLENVWTSAARRDLVRLMTDLPVSGAGCSNIKSERKMIPTEPIGSIPGPLKLIAAASTFESIDPALEQLYEEAVRDTVERFQETGFSPFSEDTTTRDAAFQKVRARVAGTAMASDWLGYTR